MAVAVGVEPPVAVAVRVDFGVRVMVAVAFGSGVLVDFGVLLLLPPHAASSKQAAITGARSRRIATSLMIARRYPRRRPFARAKRAAVANTPAIAAKWKQAVALGAARPCNSRLWWSVGDEAGGRAG
ncbi:MAG: hypothetical protein ABI629_08925 [bacterium]